MEYGQWMSSSMTGRETAVRVDTKPRRLGEGSIELQGPPCPGQRNSYPAIVAAIISFFCHSWWQPMQSGPEETEPDVKLFLHKRQRNISIESTYSSTPLEMSEYLDPDCVGCVCRSEHLQDLRTEVWLMVCIQYDRHLGATPGFLGGGRALDFHNVVGLERIGRTAPSSLPCRQLSGRVPVSFTVFGAPSGGGGPVVVDQNLP